MRVLGWLLAGEHIRLSAACNDMMEIQKNVRVLGWQLAGEHTRISAGKKIGVSYMMENKK